MKNLSHYIFRFARFLARVMCAEEFSGENLRSYHILPPKKRFLETIKKERKILTPILITGVIRYGFKK